MRCQHSIPVVLELDQHISLLLKHTLDRLMKINETNKLQNSVRRWTGVQGVGRGRKLAFDENGSYPNHFVVSGSISTMLKLGVRKQKVTCVFYCVQGPQLCLDQLHGVCVWGEWLNPTFCSNTRNTNTGREGRGCLTQRRRGDIH